MQQRKKYTKEFKLDAVSLITVQGHTRIEAARCLGINVYMLGHWVKELNQDDGQAFRGNGKLSAEQEEIRKLKAAVKRLEMEKDILKNVWSAPNLQDSIADRAVLASMYPACL